MSTKEQKLYEHAVQVICKRLTVKEFAQLNGKSYRQSTSIKKPRLTARPL